MLNIYAPAIPCVIIIFLPLEALDFFEDGGTFMPNIIHGAVSIPIFFIVLVSLK